MVTCSSTRIGRSLPAFALVLSGCYSIDRLTVPESGEGHYLTLLGIGDDGALFVETSTASGTVAYGLAHDEAVTDWYPSGQRMVAMQFPATALINEFSEVVAPDDVTIARASVCIDTCDGTRGNFRLKPRRTCSKYWDGSPTKNSAFQFYDEVDGVWTPRVGETVAADVHVDDIRCAFALELK